MGHKMQSGSLFNVSLFEPPRVESGAQNTAINQLNSKDQIEPDIAQAARDFETAFIAQMLKFSGLADAITTGGGEDMAAFADFYIQSFAEEISDTGGFGLADEFYQKLILKSREASSEGSHNVQL
jgi:Rod binding domain-containing protein